jgi:hypothetical protein
MLNSYKKNKNKNKKRERGRGNIKIGSLLGIYSRAGQDIIQKALERQV